MAILQVRTLRASGVSLPVIAKLIGSAAHAKKRLRSEETAMQGVRA